MRDTGASQSLLLDNILPLSEKTSVNRSVEIQGVELGSVQVPLHMIHLKSDLVSGPVIVGIRPSLPIEGVSMILGNDLAKDRVVPAPIFVSEPEIDESTEHLEVQYPGIFPSCVVTRSVSRAKEKDSQFVDESIVDLSDTFLADTFCLSPADFSGGKDIPGQDADSFVSREQLIKYQKQDPDLSRLRNEALSQQEVDKVPVGYFIMSDILMRKWRPPDALLNDEWRVKYQIVLPPQYRIHILSMAHELPMSGHLGVNKTYDRVLQHFFWPNLRSDVRKFCKTCHKCQVVGKPNQKIPSAPLKPIPAFGEPFSHVLVDCVGPLPRTKSGNQYLLTIMCLSTRYPEAIPIRKITAPVITKALTRFFSIFGLPKIIQSDQGSNFTSRIFKQSMRELGVKHTTSSAYHPESQGALERFHQTLKSMIKTYCHDSDKNWDDGIHFLLFAVRDVVQESLGFSPNELVFGHTVRGPMKLLKEKWLEEDHEQSLLTYVSEFRYKLTRACQIAKDNLTQTQTKMKHWYDKNAKQRTFNPGDKVLVLFPILGQPLQAKYHGPCVIESKVNDVDYIVKTPDRRKSRQLCHINMLKPYHSRDEASVSVSLVSSGSKNESNDSKIENQSDVQFDMDDICQARLHNSCILNNLSQKFGHLTVEMQNSLEQLIHSYSKLFPDVPTKTDIICHDVDVGSASPIKQHPYRMNMFKLAHLRSEIEYMLTNGIIEPSFSNWSSPCILVPKADKTYRFCSDFRKVNSVTKTDSFPIPRVDDCIDRVGRAKFVTKLDLLKGYWQVPLTERAKDISAFVTPDALYNYTVMPFGMKNSAATFQRMINGLISGLPNCAAYIDDIVIYSDTWEEHFDLLSKLFQRLARANLTVNLPKSDFVKANVTFLGHVVGSGRVCPVTAKVETILSFPEPQNKRQLMRFLGMVGYYRKFCKNFATIAAPLTNLLKKAVKYCWNSQSQQSFDTLKGLLSDNPVLQAPNFELPFSLEIDASDSGVGAVLIQLGLDSYEHPICFFSKKFDKHQVNYSTVEKEALALVMALNHFEVYLQSCVHPIIVYSDHNPLTFINKMKNKNRRLLRWSLMVQEYDIEVKHIKGKENIVADALSRIF